MAPCGKIQCKKAVLENKNFTFIYPNNFVSNFSSRKSYNLLVYYEEQNLVNIEWYISRHQQPLNPLERLLSPF